MTERELRQKVVDKINSWMGLSQYDYSNQVILDTYNSHKPLARGYRIQRGDAWCATTVSAVAIACGLTEIMPTEVSCPEMVKLYQKHELSRWEENDAYVPDIGDIILYDWQDNGVGDNKGVPDHIGIVTKVDGTQITITEGNMGGKVGKRVIPLNGKFIRGYCLPNYAWMAGVDMDRWHKVEDIKSSYYRREVQRLIKNGVLAGKDGDLDLSEDMLRCILICERMLKK